jgi:anti-anti-sigma factor
MNGAVIDVDRPGRGEQFAVTRGVAGAAVVSGELDASNAETLVQRLLAQGAGVPTLTVDLRPVTFLDCAAVGALAIVASTRRALWRRTVLLVSTGSSADRVLSLAEAARFVDGLLRFDPVPVAVAG